MVAIAIIIFMFSAQPGEQSSQTSGIVVEIATAIVHTGFDSLSSEDQAKVRDVLEIVIRKLAHFTEFAGFGGSIYLFMMTLPFNKEWIRRITTVGSGIAYAASDEFHQLFVPGREGHIRDVCIDSAGIVTGMFVLILMVFIIREIVKKDINTANL